MKIAIVGTGYVGLVTGTCFAEMGTEGFCVDVDKNKIDNLKKGIVPIYEPGLDELVARNMQAGRLHFTTELKECLDEVEVLFSAVGTPPDEDGSADLKYVLEVARTVGSTAYSQPPGWPNCAKPELWKIPTRVSINCVMLFLLC